ncbi:MAG: bifunctional methylenetetrahydrofolate dehydrogenase/methenyltetrahydrofolate cyclohydrolase [Candidatus Buchananbacteria bacterium]|nr:bifunctional methylenetetrahydrofolate dehydrogenase/methenyltetrahydrofolate cyclohydrolase [Candidatus Buchananbacteria bacterium]
MPAKIIDGKKIADKILLEIKQEVAKLKNRPGLAVVLIGNNPASNLYLRLKEKACQKVGVDFHSYFIDDDCSEKQILNVIDFLNKDPEIDGILIQLPLPQEYNTEKIIKKIKPEKDIDGFHPQSQVISPNVLGIIELLKATDEDLKDKKITILSNSKKFAQPFKKLLPLSQVSYLSSQNSNLKSQTKKADILIVAIGKPKFIKSTMIKKDAILIDVGINKVNDKVVGDIDPACDKKASWRSPVPGGVGPMTVTMLLKNLVKIIK